MPSATHQVQREGGQINENRQRMSTYAPSVGRWPLVVGGVVLLRSIPSKCRCYFTNGKGYPGTSSYLQTVTTRLLSRDRNPRPRSIHTIGPFCINDLSKSSAYTHCHSDRRLRCTHNVAHLFSRMPAGLLFAIHRHIVKYFSYRHCCCRYHGNRHPVSPRRRRQVTQMFGTMNVNAGPGFSRCRCTMT